MSGAALERITTALETHGSRIVRRGQQITAQCPAHEDHSPSLSVRATDTRVRVHCFAGCEDLAVLDALGLAVADLYNEVRGRDLARYVYADAAGSPVRTVHRRQGKRFTQSGDTRSTPVLYRLPRVIEAVAAGAVVYLVEGEEDVHAVEAAGAVATTAPQGASSFAKVDVSPLTGARVIAVPDLDAPGSGWLEAVHRRLSGVAAGLQVRRPLAGKDVDDHLLTGHGLDELAVVEQAPRAAVPGSAPIGREPGTDVERPTYFDVAALLDGDLPDPPATEVLARSDGVCLFYAGQMNLLFGDPESGKTFVALAAAAEALRLGRTAMVVDLDHNGPAATVSRLLLLGAPVPALRDLARFRYVEPEDRWHLLAIVEDAATWHPCVVVLDSIGELLPVFGASSNSPDDFTLVHAAVMKPLAMTGAAVISIDHLAKNTESRAQGATGTAAKRRAIGGTSIRVKVTETFVPGSGGAALLLIHKDRHGGLRQHCPTEDREPIAGTFTLDVDRITGATSWRVVAPTMTERNPAELPAAADVEAVAALDPPPHSVEDARARLGWRKERAVIAMRRWREQGAISTVPGSEPVPGTAGTAVPGSAPPVSEPGTARLAVVESAPTTCSSCGEPMTFVEVGQSTHPGCAA